MSNDLVLRKQGHRATGPRSGLWFHWRLRRSEAAADMAPHTRRMLTRDRSRVWHKASGNMKLFGANGIDKRRLTTVGMAGAPDISTIPPIIAERE